MSVFFQINVEKATRLDVLLAENITIYSRTRLKGLIIAGKVMINETLIQDPAYKVYGIVDIYVDMDGCILEENIYLEKSMREVDFPLEVIFEDNDIVVINKPAGVSVHYGAGDDDFTLVNALRYRFKNNLSRVDTDRPGIVHRLDRDTSGVLLIAKNDDVHDSVTNMFKNREIYKEYKAFVFGVPKLKFFSMNNFISRSKQNRLKYVVSNRYGKEAISKFFVEEQYSNFASKIKCIIETGRTHQIRVHLSYNKTPVIGDNLYGYKKVLKGYDAFFNTFNRNALHAFELKFVHPITLKEISCVAPIPKELHELEVILRSEAYKKGI